MARKIIIDTDPGQDDAVAILLALASPELEVLGIVPVAGNVPLATTARNARSIVELAGRPELPVYAGCPRPLGGKPLASERSPGTSGLGSGSTGEFGVRQSRFINLVVPIRLCDG